MRRKKREKKMLKISENGLEIDTIDFILFFLIITLSRAITYKLLSRSIFYLFSLESAFGHRYLARIRCYPIFRCLFKKGPVDQIPYHMAESFDCPYSYGYHQKQ